MIRIDEIYNHTFWPWLSKNCPGTRMFFCDPFGHTDPAHLFNLGRDDIVESDFVFMHDQEPVWTDLYQPLFDEVCRRNVDTWPGPGEYHADKSYIPDGLTQWIRSDLLLYTKPNTFGHVVVSERGEFVEDMCKKYQWTLHYYFYHGWACMDWFRGYDKTFLIPRAQDRCPTRTFMSPNRIVAGKRDHRVLFLYHVFKQNLEHNHISAPRICPVEGVDIASIAQKYTNVYQDISTVFAEADLPRTFEGEDTQTMSSCWLTNFAEAQDSLVYVPTETVYFGRRLHITEKTFKAIALEMPFVLVAPAGSLSYLREYGFKTFNNIFDESYDEELDDIRRIERVTQLLKDLDNLSLLERQQIHRACLPIVEHNYNHFYQGGFEDILWQELLTMLNNLQKKLS
jgi:hypothetical protein